MMFDAFCRAHGLVIRDGIEAGRWVRVPTTDHPRSDNGAYKYLGEVGWAQNWATMPEPATWRPEAHEVQKVDVERIRREAERHQRKVVEGWRRAAEQASQLIASARPEEHNYLHIKGLGDQLGLVCADGRLLVPMRHWRNNGLMGAQLIGWDGEQRRYDKRMLPGMRAKGAVFRIGSIQAPRTWLVEGYATGLSLAAAVRGLMKLRDNVLVCFSAGNLTHVARELGGNLIAFADNDRSGAGEAAARAAGIQFVMSPEAGEDANDLHRRAGLFEVARVAMGAVM